MCGIFAAINKNSVTKDLLQGLEALSYRGYDSAGIAVKNNGSVSRARCEGKLENLKTHVKVNPIDGVLGIAHTRWATHGLPNEQNAHPHMTPRVSVVHNGIVENAIELRLYLENKGHSFESETDSESIAQLITYYLNAGYQDELALKISLEQIEGSYGLVVMFNDDQKTLYAARNGSPLVIGRSHESTYISSDENALSGMVTKILHLEDRELVKLSISDIELQSINGDKVERPFISVKDSRINTSKNGYNHYMLKEIHEQPSVFDRCWHHHYDKNKNAFKAPKLAIPLNNISRLTIIACGTSYFAGMVAKQWLESNCGMPVDLEIASEYRYRNAPLIANSVAIFISQSGETADTLAALKNSKMMGQKTIALVNVINSSMAHEADITIPTLAGPEIGVASTKAFISQLTTLLCFSISIAREKNKITREDEKKLIESMKEFPNILKEVITDVDTIHLASKILKNKNSALFIGRGPACALAEEGALKLKEISYIHAEAYAAGELKHGPLALVDKEMPVIVIAPPNELTCKTLSNLREVASRGGKIILISDQKNIDEHSEFISLGIQMPIVCDFLQPLLYSIPLQLMAYHTALLLGNDVDQPRNLAKSVTVE